MSPNIVEGNGDATSSKEGASTTDNVVATTDKTSPTPPTPTEEETAMEVEDKILMNLVVLPPRQKEDETSTSTTTNYYADRILLPPIRPEEPVASIRAALQEVCGYAHITKYRLVVENDHDVDASTTPSSKTLSTMTTNNNNNNKMMMYAGQPSPYTGPNAVISIPMNIKTLQKHDDTKTNENHSSTNGSSSNTTSQNDNDDEIDRLCDDFGDLSILESKGILKDGSAFRVVLERYDAASVRDHIVRLRSLLDGNAPTSMSLVAAPGSGSDNEEDNNDGKKEDGMVTEENHTNGGTSNDANGSNGTAAADAAATKPSDQKAGQIPSDMPVFSVDKPVHPDTNDLKHFFYYACGEDPSHYLENDGTTGGSNTPTSPNGTTANGGSKSSNKKKNKKKGSKNGSASPNHGSSNNGQHKDTTDDNLRDILPRLNELEEKTRISCSIRYSGFHPPPRFRQLMGDIAYLEITLPNDDEVVNVTANPFGFYINKSTTTRNGNYKFDPTPNSDKPCFSHELLDCLLQYSPSFASVWQEAVETAKVRNELSAKINEDGPFLSFFHVATRGDLPGYQSPAVASAAQGIDALINTPSWLVPIPRAELDKNNSWNRNCEHTFNPSRMEDDLSNSFGVDLRGGSTRDWNEELQVAREMPVDDLGQRIDRARLINKVLSDFGEASIQGVKAISEGQVSSMNPNEPARAQVFLHNNIFFSRAIDGGPETFKVFRGDSAAKKSAARDLSCLSVLHRIEKTDIRTLGTVVIDYMGTRYVCQSILPGILNGEKTHTLMYGTVDAGVPLVWNKEMHDTLEKTVGRSLLIASRPVPRSPLTEARAAEVEAAKRASPLYEELKAKAEEKKEEEDEKQPPSPTIDLCAPMELKGIRGSDQRMYVLDVTRLTPRDANWIPKDKGGTGRWESIGDTRESIPSTLDDDEWAVTVLRPELVTSFAQMKISKYLKENAKEVTETPTKDDDTKESTADESGKDAPEKNENETSETSESPTKPQKKLIYPSDAERIEYANSLRFNVNVFLPDIKSLAGIDDEAHKQIQEDEERAREVAAHLWDDILPGLTTEIRQGVMQSIPHDGKSLTELIHQRGVNCRYMGRLATLAMAEEEKDRQEDAARKDGKATTFQRKRMPLSWLELLECEMVARAAKHVLDRYLNDDGANVAGSPSQTIASFLSALVSDREESAAQTENRLEKASKKGEPEEEDFNSLTFFDAGGGGDASPHPIRSRFEVWTDIENEIGRRFRYTLTLFNRPGGKNGARAIYTSLLRRVCQRTGVRIVARAYDLGGSSFCGDGSRGFQIAPSYPISALDIVDVVPLVKHFAAFGEGFVPCGAGPSVGLPPLHISLLDARNALEAAHLHHNKKSLSRALDLAQEAAALYQRVTDNPAHPGIVRCMDLMAAILFDAGEAELAAANCSRALGLMVQVQGFDNPEVINLHFVLFQFHVSSHNYTKAIKHIKAAAYLMDLVGGPHHIELSNAYNKCGGVYHSLKDFDTAMLLYDEASKRVTSDRFLEGIISKSSGGMHAMKGDFKVAVTKEKHAYQIFSTLLGPTHQITKETDLALRRYMAGAVHQGSKDAKEKTIQKEAEAAAAIADQIVAEEAAKEEQQRRKSKNGQKKKSGNKGKK